MTAGRVVAVSDGEAGEFRLPDDQQVRDPAGRLLIGADGTVYRYDEAGRLAEQADTDGTATPMTLIVHKSKSSVPATK